MGRPAAGWLLLLLLGLAGCAEGLPASTTLKRKKARKKTADLRQLNESLAGGEQFVARAVERYLSNEELEAALRDFEKRCKGIAQLHKIGSSRQGRSLWALEISDHPGQEEAEPAVKYVGNVHGDEPTGRVLTLALAEWLCANYRSDARAKRIVQSMHLWLVPSMNPDGFEQHTRGNSAMRDLNRDFPDRLRSKNNMELDGREQPETVAIMEWSSKIGFVASASIHEGALVANYPWDGTPDMSTRYEATPDDATFRHLASLYATSHLRMSKPDNTEFPAGGTTNGAAWYPIYGSMQDWNYVRAGCMELTLELSEGKWPDEQGLAQLWEENKDAMLAFPLAAAYSGVWGTVHEEGRSSKGQELTPLGGATITVAGVDPVLKTVTREGRGDYYRPLAPGRYTVVVSSQGFKTFATNLTVPSDGSGAQRHFVLARQGSSSSGEVAYSLRSLGAAGAAAGAAAEPVLPWKAARKARAGAAAIDGELAVAAGTRARDRLLMIGAGVLVVQGLWVTHRRLKRRSHQRRA